MTDSIERLSFELTVGALSDQERYLASLRVRAGTVLGVASVAGSFLGRGTAARTLDVWTVSALVAFALCVGSAIWVLLPRELILSIHGAELLADADGKSWPDVGEAFRAVCTWIEPDLELNRRTIDGLADWLAFSCVLLAVELVLWTVGATATFQT